MPVFPEALDIRTLCFITVLFSLGLGGGLFAFGLTQDAFYGLKKVGIGLLFVGFGFLFMGFRGFVPDAVSIVLANSLLLTGFAVINDGIERSRNIPPSDRLLSVAIVIVNTVLFIVYTYVYPSLALRVFWVGLFLALFSGMCIRNLLRKKNFKTTTPRLMAVLGFSMFGVLSLLRSWWVMDEVALQDFMSAGAIHSVTWLTMILLLLFLSFGFVWMANEFLLQELKQYESIISSTPDAILLVDRKGRYRLVNDTMLRIFGMSKQEVLGKSSIDLFGKDFYESVTRPNLEKVFEGRVAETALWLDLPGGRKRYVAITYHPVPDVGGNDVFAAINVKDMTELYYVQEENQRIFDLSLDMLCIAGMDGYFKKLNPSWTRVLGWSEEELLQSKWLDFVHPDDVKSTIDAGKELAEGNNVIGFVNRYRTKDGSYKHISWMSYPDYKAQLIYAVARDVSEWILMEEELRALASKDPLTGADNRRTFMQRLKSEIQRSVRYATPLSLLMLDIDHFKRINDAHGHAVGDQVLRQCVEVCIATLRSTDVFGRIGGEEFSAVLPHTNLDTGCSTAERLRKNLEGLVVETDSGAVRFSVSVGVVELQSEESMESILKRGDDALYRAKRNGRNRVEKG